MLWGFDHYWGTLYSNFRGGGYHLIFLITVLLILQIVNCCYGAWTLSLAILMMMSHSWALSLLDNVLNYFTLHQMSFGYSVLCVPLDLVRCTKQCVCYAFHQVFGVNKSLSLGAHFLIREVMIFRAFPVAWCIWAYSPFNILNRFLNVQSWKSKYCLYEVCVDFMSRFVVVFFSQFLYLFVIV